MNVIDQIFDEFNRIRKDIEISKDTMISDLCEMKDHIVLYGAGSAGIAFMKYLNDFGLKVRYFSDGDPNKKGSMCQNIEVISPEEITEKVGENALVIVTINTDGKRYCKSFSEALRIGGHNGVHQRLKQAGCKNVVDYTYFRRCHSLFKNDTYNLPSCSDVDIMIKNRSDICDVYNMLEDDLSKETFEKIVRFRLIDDSITVPTLTQDKQYFEFDYCGKDADSCFVDCGAFNGISMKSFLFENHGHFEHYYGFEPDPYNFSALKNYIETLDIPENKISLFNAAVSEQTGKGKLYSLSGPGSFMSEIGNTIVDTITIDSALNGSKASYIKMNIEGSESSALKGAEYTIKEQKPALAVAGYHKTWDLWEIPMLIKSFRNDYRIRLRSYMNHISFVFYCY